MAFLQIDLKSKALGRKAHLRPVCVEAPGQAAVLDFKVGFILPQEELVP